ncbi:hypothetical protein T265_08019 [Opisthorchis viverrini]|uniref:Uncharacterized protein n=1 Tax=Opisthorchis viverrini TaxID=6198 RepID=A0A074ZLP2_OPIVI|nr:hypothetical protein T265_08019 [Opisthorchis viverrini]KER24280.1 hypothetical protein T265_08019 [Opisthorchis viverrini]
MPNYHATRRKYGDWITAKLPKPRQEKSRCKGRTGIGKSTMQQLENECSVVQSRLGPSTVSNTRSCLGGRGRDMREITKIWGVVCATRLVSPGPRDPHCV